MDTSAISELNRRFGIPGIAQVVAGNGGLAKVAVTAPAAAGEIYLLGAQITSWRPQGAEEVIFVSSKSHWQVGKAIRGGVPICFPWFGGKADDPWAPAHGFVRSILWTLDSIAQSPAGVTVSLSTGANADSKKWWSADFQAVLRATFGSELVIELTVRNVGAAPLRFEEALHAYFRVGAIEQVSVEGLSDVDYLDKTDAGKRKTQKGPITIERETDRVYLDTTGPIELVDRSLGRRLTVTREDSHTAVVWNPWIAKSKALSDFGDEEYHHMLCIEASNVADFTIPVPPGHEHTLKTTVGVAIT
ncbi:MAG TPA: D-hexose-6-phosphate mutarotase [Pirellulales bacterium]|nr:D-hexose-6-phosphate mutarotase [Pirellulales bacterium]